MSSKQSSAFLIFFLSHSLVSFEILATRISSVVYVSDYAFIIISFALVGLSCGAIVAFYKLPQPSELFGSAFLRRVSFGIALSFSLFIFLVASAGLTNPFLYFLLVFLPFFLAGILYAVLFRTSVQHIFLLYACDLCGAATGALAPLWTLQHSTAPNNVLLLALFMATVSTMVFFPKGKKWKKFIYTGAYILLGVLLLSFGKKELLGRVPIGKYPEKDFYFVYPQSAVPPTILESRWSLYGRADLVRYHQDMVLQLFVDGAAGSPMYRFSGKVSADEKELLGVLLQNSTALPFLCFRNNEKDTMLVIGPGGGKEILLGLFANVTQIIGVEVNPDFVQIVKDYSAFNGGIYTRFPNVKIEVEEGRDFVRRTSHHIDLLVMALPSTEQLQNIDALATNENYLLTVEAFHDYFATLTEEGYIVITVHNTWELLRLLVTVLTTFEEKGITVTEALNHFALIYEADGSPTAVIKKKQFTSEEVYHWQYTTRSLPPGFPRLVYLPSHSGENKNGAYGLQPSVPPVIAEFFHALTSTQISLREIVSAHPYNIAPCRDDSPYFYKVTKGIPSHYGWLLVTFVIVVGAIIVFFFRKVRSTTKTHKGSHTLLKFSILTALCLGGGFMMIEITLFQKLILFLGTPTISLSLLLSSLLLGMGVGSMLGHRIFAHTPLKRLAVVCSIVVFYGMVLLLTVFPMLFMATNSFPYSVRILFLFILLLPLGFCLGIPFPTLLSFLREQKVPHYIPWIYGINGAMSVVGSVLASILSIQYNYSLSFFVGVFSYVLFFIIVVRFQPTHP